MKHKWLAELSRKMVPKPDPIPKGFVTVEQAAKEWGVSLSASYDRLKKATGMGLVEFRVIKTSICGRTGGQLKACKVYRMK